ncbi:hydroquinone glucosyltransferase-like [Senna tora]|uniref:Glycosyltransferase n=1 Tax=Senna tora TaxID=362788 RepID=A0A834TML1_9FABA|nr:hydroquinone glucosyltransferase-like [Senna tora]
MEKKTHIAVVPSPGFSHLVPIIEFSKRFIHLHPDFHVTCIIPTLGSPPTSSKAYLQSLPSNIHSIFLPPISEDAIPKDIYVGKKIQLTITNSLPSLLDELKSLTSKAPLAAIVADPFAFEVLDFAKELNTLSFMYFPASAMTLSFFLYIPKLDQQISGEFRDSTQLIQLPGCVPIHGSDLPDPVQDRSSQVYEELLERSRRLCLIDGILVNSFVEMEEGPIRALKEEAERGKFPLVYPVGPITQIGSNQNGSDSESECIRWLENQPPNSVLYVSFGSGGTLSQHQINELAFGLEMSEQKFLWVVRAPSNSTSAAYLGSSTNEDPLQFLPEGFLERTKEQGLVIPSWAPQIPILSHSSTAAFLSHCGWNSVLESIQHGVPLITWPLFAEQRMNSFMLTNVLKVGLRPKVNNDSIVERDEIAKVIKNLMEGEESKEIRRRVKDLRENAISAVKEDGSSTKTMAEVAQKWKSFSCSIYK